MIKKYVSETFVYNCPIDGMMCGENTILLHNGAACTATANDSVPVCGNDVCWCPGTCGRAMRKKANECICKECGLDPKQYLDVNGIPYVYVKGHQR